MFFAHKLYICTILPIAHRVHIFPEDLSESERNIVTWVQNHFLLLLSSVLQPLHQMDTPYNTFRKGHKKKLGSPKHLTGSVYKLEKNANQSNCRQMNKVWISKYSVNVYLYFTHVFLTLSYIKYISSQCYFFQIPLSHIYHHHRHYHYVTQSARIYIYIYIYVYI